VRELENEIQRALALAEPSETLSPDHFSERLRAILPPIEASLQRLPMKQPEGSRRLDDLSPVAA
jgi:hypothetical protein